MPRTRNGEDAASELSEGVVAAGAVVNVTEYLKGMTFPATVPDLERVARQNGADESAIEEIRRLPADRTFHDPGQLFAALGDEVRGL